MTYDFTPRKAEYLAALRMYKDRLVRSEFEYIGILLPNNCDDRRGSCFSVGEGTLQS